MDFFITSVFDRDVGRNYLLWYPEAGDSTDKRDDMKW
jgi:hypothetical protein